VNDSVCLLLGCRRRVPGSPRACVPTVPGRHGHPSRPAGRSQAAPPTVAAPRPPTDRRGHRPGSRAPSQLARVPAARVNLPAPAGHTPLACRDTSAGCVAKNRAHTSSKGRFHHRPGGTWGARGVRAGCSSTRVGRGHPPQRGSRRQARVSAGRRRVRSRSTLERDRLGSAVRNPVRSRPTPFTSRLAALRCSVRRWRWERW
jgi:hypothetical protein